MKIIIKNPLRNIKRILSSLDERIDKLEQFSSKIPLEPVSHTAELEELRRELEESKQQIQLISNRLLTVLSYPEYPLEC